MKHTKGNWRASYFGVGGKVHVLNDEGKGFGKHICKCSDCEESEANARLIAEAGTVANETGKTPRQLANEHAQMLEALQRVSEVFKASDQEQFAALLLTDNAIKKATE